MYLLASAGSRAASLSLSLTISLILSCTCVCACHSLVLVLHSLLSASLVLARVSSLVTIAVKICSSSFTQSRGRRSCADEGERSATPLLLISAVVDDTAVAATEAVATARVDTIADPAATGECAMIRSLVSFGMADDGGAAAVVSGTTSLMLTLDGTRAHDDDANDDASGDDGVAGAESHAHCDAPVETPMPERSSAAAAAASASSRSSGIAPMIGRLGRRLWMLMMSFETGLGALFASPRSPKLIALCAGEGE